MEPSEVEFLAENELVTIIPNFSEDKISLISVGKLFCLKKSVVLSVFVLSVFLGRFRAIQCFPGN